MPCIKCKKSIPDDAIYCPYCGKKQVQQRKKTIKRANGTGSVYKLSGNLRNPWKAVITKYVDNVRETIPIGCYATKTEALEALARTEKGKVTNKYNMSLEEIYELWKGEHFRKIGIDGQQGYVASWPYFSDNHNTKARDLSTQIIQNAIDKAIAKGMSRSKCEKIKQLGSQLCKYCMRENLIDKNYAEFVTLPKSKKSQKQIFDANSIAKLFTASDDMTAQIILTMVYSGMRVNELFSIKREDVYLEKQYMVGGEKTEAGKNRIIPIHPKIMPFVKDWYDEGHQYLISNSVGNKMDDDNFRKRKFYPLLERLGIIEPLKPGEKRKLTPHSSRHTFVSSMVSNKARPEILQQVVGHEKYETTIDYYDHITDEDIKEMVAEVSEL